MERRWLISSETLNLCNRSSRIAISKKIKMLESPLEYLGQAVVFKSFSRNELTFSTAGRINCNESLFFIIPHM